MTPAGDVVSPLQLIRLLTYGAIIVVALTLILPYTFAGELGWATVATLATGLTVAATIVATSVDPTRDAAAATDDEPGDRPTDEDQIRRRRDQAGALANVSFAAHAILAGNAAVVLDEPAWPLLAIGAALAAWDLHHLARRLAAAPVEPLPPVGPARDGHGAGAETANGQSVQMAAARLGLVQAHLQRLATTLALGLALGGLALTVRVTYDLRTLAILTMVAIVGLAVATRYIRRRSD